MAEKRERVSLDQAMKVLRRIEKTNDVPSEHREFLLARQYRIIIHLLVQTVIRLEKIVSAWRPQ